MAYAEFNDWLAANDFDRELLSPAAILKLQATWRAESAAGNNPPADPPAPAPKAPASASYEEKMRAIEEENARQDYIRDAVVRACDANVGNREKCRQLREMGEAAIADTKVDARAFDLSMLRADRAHGPMILAGSAPQVDAKVIEAAVCRTGGLEDLEKHFDGRTLEAADRHFRHGLGLQALVGHFAKRGGFRGENIKGALNSPDVLRAAFRGGDGHGEMTAGVAGPSTYSLPNVVSNVANKFMRAGFEGVDQTWRAISAKRSVTDFKAVTTLSLTGGLMYEQLPPGGEIQHGTVGELTYTNQVNTQAIMFGIDRRDLINDDTGALTSVSRRMGRGGALRLNDMFWTVFLANTAFFSAGNNNVITGGTSVLSGSTGLEALRLADAKWGAQTDPDGFPIAIKPKFLLVPTGLRVSAWNLINSTMLTGSTTANALMGTGNAFSGLYTILDSPYLSNTSYSGSSTTAWYLLADPADMPVIEVAFLNGQETPIVETTDADFNTLGIALRGYFDAGCALQEYRGGLRAAGA